MHGTMTSIKNRKGRKRKSGRRTISGRLIRPAIDPRALVGAQPHRNWLPEALRQHERAGDVLGCLNLTKRITDHCYEAGRRFGVIVGAFRQVIGAPRGTVGSGRGYRCNPSECEVHAQLLGAKHYCECESRTANYRNACADLQSAGQKAYNVTYQVVISEMIPEPNQMPDLVCGLSALAHAFGLTNRRKS